METVGGADPPSVPLIEPPVIPNGTALPAGLAPPPPGGPLHLDIPPPTTIPPPQQDGTQDRAPDSDDGSGSEHDDSEDEDSRWMPITEDQSLPCADELEYIASREEHSALEHDYFEKQTFTDLNDPEFITVETGRIDWLVTRFNGTKDDPNTDTIMRSPIVRIAGLDWQIKFYPKGDKADYLSLYLECVSMTSPDFEETEEFQEPPFPFLKGMEAQKKRRTVAVQFGVVMYNPAEPRVYEFHSEASQYSKKLSNYGWKYFTRYPRYDFHMRQHTQRQAILRDDKLAFKAFIRVVHDPTGCLWADPRTADDYVSITGLRPFTKSLQYISAAVPLLHFAPFRRFIQNLRPGTNTAKWLQPLLLKMYTRKRSSNYNNRGTMHEGDVMEMLWRLSLAMQTEYPDGTERAAFTELVGAFHSEKGTACGTSRLNTYAHPSIQAAIDKHVKVIARPALLTLELQRQEHDKKTRKWKKLTNKVKVDEKIVVEGVGYTLFAFITHCGHLHSSRYNSFVRPRGPGKGWYGYQDGKVKRLTEKQARDRHSGTEDGDSTPRSPEDGYDSPFSEFHEPVSEVTCAVMYVRDGYAADTFNAPSVDLWIPPHLTQQDLDNPAKTAVHEHFQNVEGDVYGQHGRPPMSEEEFARLQALRVTIEHAATQATPDPVLMDGEDVVMRDIDDESNFTIEEQETEPMQDENLEAGTLDWLGRPYYEGRWQNKKFHGGGHLIASNGDEYIGQFSNGLQHGFGKMIYCSTGDVYEGYFREGARHGNGKLTEHSTGNVYEGGWQDDRQHGNFTLTGTVTEEDKSTCAICFDKEMSTAFYDCGHVVACHDCAHQVDICPVCRKRVIARLQLYGVKIAKS